MKSNVPEYSGNRYEKLIEINLKSIFSFNFFVINYRTGSEANPHLKHPDYFAGSEPRWLVSSVADPDPGCEKIRYGSGSGSRVNFDTDPDPAKKA